MNIIGERNDKTVFSSIQFPPSVRQKTNIEEGDCEEMTNQTTSPQPSVAALKNNDPIMPKREAQFDENIFNMYNRSFRRYPHENIMHIFTEVANFMRTEWEQNNITQIRNKDLESQLKKNQETLQLIFNEKCHFEAQSAFLKERINDISRW
jgi:hypothetical protein